MLYPQPMVDSGGAGDLPRRREEAEAPVGEREGRRAPQEDRQEGDDECDAAHHVGLLSPGVTG